MTADPVTGAADRGTDFRLVVSQIRALLQDEPDALANTANFVAVLWHSLPNVNWLGVYLLRANELVLGPFQGKPACTRIPVGKGVCGTAAATLQAQRVADVHAFDGHIACDPDSRSELVVPLLVHGNLVGVVDIDSPLPGRFSEADQAGVEASCAVLAQVLENQGIESLLIR